MYIILTNAMSYVYIITRTLSYMYIIANTLSYIYINIIINIIRTNTALYVY